MEDSYREGDFVEELHELGLVLGLSQLVADTLLLITGDDLSK